jgi:hypothetical protein
VIDQIAEQTGDRRRGKPYTLALLILWKESSGAEGIPRWLLEQRQIKFGNRTAAAPFP